MDDKAPTVDSLEKSTKKGRSTRARVAIAAILAGGVGALGVAGGIAVWHGQAAPGATTPSPPVSVATSSAATSTSPATFTTRQIGDWAFICPAVTPGGSGCFIQQQLRTRDQKQIVLVWTIRADAAGGVHSVWEVPADIVHERGMVVDLGDGKPKGLPFSGCTKEICTAKALLAPDFVLSLEAAATVVAAVSAPGKDQPVRFGLSAKGLGDALRQLSSGSTAEGG